MSSLFRPVPLLFVLAMTCARPAAAQQDPMFSQYMFNTLAFNPGYAGSADVFSMMALCRHQWVGFEGAPSTQTLALQSPLPLNGLSMGGNMVLDRTGPASLTGSFLLLS